MPPRKTFLKGIVIANSPSQYNIYMVRMYLICNSKNCNRSPLEINFVHKTVNRSCSLLASVCTYNTDQQLSVLASWSYEMAANRASTEQRSGFLLPEKHLRFLFFGSYIFGFLALFKHRHQCFLVKTISVGNS